jgi:hypothetical protein
MITFFYSESLPSYFYAVDTGSAAAVVAHFSRNTVAATGAFFSEAENSARGRSYDTFRSPA